MAEAEKSGRFLLPVDATLLPCCPTGGRCCGLAVLFVPTFYDLFTGAWISEEQGHGPIIFGLALWLIYRKWPEMLAADQPPRGQRGAGWPILAFGLVLHMLGRSQHILMFDIGSII
jgi:hypothetical protein